MKSKLTTLCYIEKENCYLMLHRVKKEQDINKNKWIGVGGHFEEGESPEDCLLREVFEETGLILTSYRFRGIVTFCSENYPTEYMCLYTADGYTGTLTECTEGELAFVAREEITKLKLWDGDRLFLELLKEERPFFSLKLCYHEDGTWYRAVLDGRELELLISVMKGRAYRGSDGAGHGTSLWKDAQDSPYMDREPDAGWLLSGASAETE
ncbi:MAG: NUDIX hydrolase [Suilimivivens sp.]